MQPDTTMTPALEVTVLVSIGRHPVTGRARRADQDARGVELARSLADAEVSLLHAGELAEASEPALRGYLAWVSPNSRCSSSRRAPMCCLRSPKPWTRPCHSW